MSAGHRPKAKKGLKPLTRHPPDQGKTLPISSQATQLDSLSGDIHSGEGGQHLAPENRCRRPAREVVDHGCPSKRRVLSSS